MKAEMSLSFAQLLRLVLQLPEEKRAKVAKALEQHKGSAPTPVSMKEFSLRKTRKQLEGYDISISDAIIEERRNAL
jgi:hypothetical protein